jgi:CubicO group peptidase (beta-lactamase class C family)
VRLRYYVVVALSALSAPLSAQSLPRTLDHDIQRALVDFQVPGLALAIVKDGKVILSRGYGVKKLGDTARVTPQTVFQIASNTKQFTTALIAMLAEDGKLSWDDPVQKYLPYFQLADPWVTREFTLRDLVTHRSGLGLGAGDLLWFHSTYSRDDISRRIRFARPATSFRSAYAYDNVLYIVAGQVIEAVTGQSWDDVVRDRIFRPLGMTGTTTTTAAFLASPEAATPSAIEVGQAKPAIVPVDTADNIAPAGGINSSAADLAKWVTVQLDSGVAAHGRLYSARSAREMWGGVTVKPIDADTPDSLQSLTGWKPNFSLYALGWNLRDFRGRKMVYHTGGPAGMNSQITLIPSERLGIIVLTNSESELRGALTYQLLDAFLGVTQRPANDWLGTYAAQERQDRRDADSSMHVAGATRDTASRPTLPLARYAGTYTDAMYGDASITLERDTLVLRFSRSPAFTGPLVFWQYGTFVARWRQAHIEPAYVTFQLNPDGSIASFRMSAVSPAADFSFDYQDLLFRPKPQSR